MRKFKSIIIRWWASVFNWVDDHVCYRAADHPIGWRDHLRWWMEGKLDSVFAWAYAGSDEELQAVYQAELPLEHFNERQRALLTLPRQFYGAHCCHCFFDGWLDQCIGDHCPDCGESVYLDEFDPTVPRPVRPLVIRYAGGGR